MLRRLIFEKKDLEANKPSKWTLISANIPNNSNIKAVWTASIKGPSQSIYDGYNLDVTIEIPLDYPYKPPAVKFVPAIFHPLVCEGKGCICLDILTQNWSPALTLRKAMDAIENILIDSNMYQDAKCEHPQTSW